MITKLIVVLTDPQKAELTKRMEEVEYGDNGLMFLQAHINEWLDNSESLKDSLTKGMLEK